MSGLLVAVEVADDQVFAVHAAVVDHLLGLERAFAIDEVDRDAGLLRRQPTASSSLPSPSKSAQPSAWPSVSAVSIWFGPGRAGLLGVDHDAGAVPRIDGGEHPATADASELDLARRAFADHRRVGAVLAALPRDQPFVLAVTISSCGSLSRFIDRKLCWMWFCLGDDLLRPRIGLRIGRRPERQQPGAGAFRPLDALRVERRDDQLELLVAVDVGPLDPVQVRLGANREHLPRGRAAGRVLPHPLQRAGVGPRPAGAERDVEPAVAVDVVRRERDVVGGGHAGAENDLLLPLRRLEPDQLGRR